jgi:PAS domain S-box-containing protein
MRAIFDQEYEFVGLLTVDGILLEVNHSALQSVGASRGQVIGQAFWDTPWWRKSGSNQRLREAVAKAAAGEFVRFEEEFVDAEQRQRWVDFSLKPVRNEAGAVQFLLPEGRDVTRLKQVHARELAMQEALAQIGESASLLAHEIKNPITGIHLALRAVADQLGEEHQAVLQDLVERLQKLERTMRGTLSFARPIVLDRRRITPRALLEGAAHALRPEFERAGVALEVVADKDLPEIDVDVALLEEALGNLLKNALEVRMDGGRVLLTATRNVSEGLVLTVEDDGPGISPKVAPELFKPFVSDKVGGTGLGLALCKRIVEEHGGRILCGKSTLGGACFGLHLPLPGRTVRLHQAHLRSQA